MFNVCAYLFMCSIQSSMPIGRAYTMAHPKGLNFRALTAKWSCTRVLVKKKKKEVSSNLSHLCFSWLPSLPHLWCWCYRISGSCFAWSILVGFGCGNYGSYGSYGSYGNYGGGNESSKSLFHPLEESLLHRLEESLLHCLEELEYYCHGRLSLIELLIINKLFF